MYLNNTTHIEHYHITSPNISSLQISHIQIDCQYILKLLPLNITYQSPIHCPCCQPHHCPHYQDHHHSTGFEF